jgi:hypothetical protein
MGGEADEHYATQLLLAQARATSIFVPVSNSSMTISVQGSTTIFFPPPASTLSISTGSISSISTSS